MMTIQIPRYFRIRGKNYFGKKYAYMTDLEFRMPNTAVVSCKTCGTEMKYPNGPGACVLNNGKVPSDMIAGGQESIVSEKMRDGLIRLGVHGVTFFPIKILSASEEIRKNGLPNYYYIHCHHRVRRKNHLVRGHVNKTCHECFNFIGDWEVDHRVEFEDDVPSDSRLFSVYPIESRLLFCTFDVIQMARELRLTNCEFDPIETIGVSSHTWGGIDYLGKKWPPDCYPPG